MNADLSRINPQNPLCLCTCMWVFLFGQVIPLLSFNESYKSVLQIWNIILGKISYWSHHYRIHSYQYLLLTNKFLFDFCHLLSVTVQGKENRCNNLVSLSVTCKVRFLKQFLQKVHRILFIWWIKKFSYSHVHNIVISMNTNKVSLITVAISRTT